jgi:hypothetical protein
MTAQSRAPSADVATWTRGWGVVALSRFANWHGADKLLLAASARGNRWDFPGFLLIRQKMGKLMAWSCRTSWDWKSLLQWTEIKQANYPEWATATGLWILVSTFVDRGVSRGQRGGTTTAVNLSFLDRSCYFFFQVAPHLSSRAWVYPVPDPLLLRKSRSAGKRTRDLYDCSQKLWPLDDRDGQVDLTTFNYQRSRI